MSKLRDYSAGGGQTHDEGREDEARGLQRRLEMACTSHRDDKIAEECEEEEVERDFVEHGHDLQIARKTESALRRAEGTAPRITGYDGTYGHTKDVEERCAQDGRLSDKPDVPLLDDEVGVAKHDEGQDLLTHQHSETGLNDRVSNPVEMSDDVGLSGMGSLSV